MHVQQLNLPIYIASKSRSELTHIVDQLVLDGFSVSGFDSAQALWDHFQIHPVRFVITDRRFHDGISGLELTEHIRKFYCLPYVYVLMRSVLESLDDVESGLAAGVDDYLNKPHNAFQIRTRILIGHRWLTYIDSLFAESPDTAQYQATNDATTRAQRLQWTVQPQAR